MKLFNEFSMTYLIKNAFYELGQSFISILPIHFSILKIIYYRLFGADISLKVFIDRNVYILNPKFIKIGKNTKIDSGVHLLSGISDKTRLGREEICINKCINRGRIKIGEDCHIAANCILQGHGEIEIGNNVGIATNVKLYSMTHHFSKELHVSDRTIPCNEKVSFGKIKISNNCGLSIGCIVMPDVTIGENSIVGPLIIVRKSVRKNVIVVEDPNRRMLVPLM